MQTRFATLTFIWAVSSLASLAWADDAPWRPAAPAGETVLIARGQKPDDEARVQLGTPRVRLGRPKARTENAAGGIQPTAFKTEHFVTKPMPRPGDEPAATEPPPAPPEPKSEPLPLPAPVTSDTIAPVPAPQHGHVFQIPPGDTGYFQVQPEGEPGFVGTLPPTGCPGEWCGPMCGDACPPDGCLPLGCMFEGPHGPLSRIYLNFEFLAWTLKSDTVPALVTTSSQADLGILGRPTTQTLVGGDINQEVYFGGRIGAGIWFGQQERFGMMGSFFALQQRTKEFSFSSNGSPLYARPFFNPNLGGFEDSQLVAAVEDPIFPDARQLRGTINVQSQTQLLGADLNFRWNLLHCIHEKNCDIKGFNIDLIAGVRYLRLDDNLLITEDLALGFINQAPGERFLVRDEFSTLNNFYGGQVGLMAETRYKRWFLNFTGKIGLGATQSQVDIAGSTTRSIVGGGSQTRPGGLLAGEFNSGTHRQTSFSVVPEVGVNVGYQLTDGLRIYVGYNLLVWTNVARPGDQIDRVVNPRYLPFYNEPDARTGARRPAFVFRDTTFWAQGVVAGLEWRF